jgi:hypothetical protein
MVQVRGGLRPGTGCIYEVGLTYMGGVTVARRLIRIEDDLLETTRRDFSTAATVLDFEHRWFAKPGTL